MSKQVVSGIGARYGVVFELASDGLPTAVAGADLGFAGTLIEGIKSLTANDPEPQRTTHYGDDSSFAQDSLPPTEVGSFTITTAKTNIGLDALLGGMKVRTINGNVYVAGNTDKRGSEPQVTAMFYRQALDTAKGSATMGKLRQWHVKIYPSARIASTSQSMEQGATDKTYNATPTIVTSTPWAETLNEVNWGASQGEFIELTTDYHPRLNVWRPNASKTAFSLSHPPYDSSSITVWVQDTGEVTPSNVNVSATYPSFTLADGVSGGKLVMALIETNAPGTT